MSENETLSETFIEYCKTLKECTMNVGVAIVFGFLVGSSCTIAIVFTRKLIERILQ